MTDSNEVLMREMAQLRADFGKMTESLAHLIKAQATASAGALGDAFGGASEAMAQKATRAGQSAMHFANDAQDSARSASHEFEASVTRNPLTALCIAAGIGLALGLASSRA